MPETLHTDGKDEERDRSVIPPMIVGDRNVSMWLQMIGIKASQYAVARLKREHRIPTKVLARDHRVPVYDSESLRKMVRAATGVSASCWLAHNENTLEAKVYVSHKAKGRSVALQHKDGGWSMFAAAVPLPGRERNQEAILIDKSSGKAYVTAKASVASGWDFSWWPGPWRIVKYCSLLRSTDPLDAGVGSGNYKGKDRRVTNLISCHYLQPETGRMVPVLVPSTILGWNYDVDTPCLFAPLNPRRKKIALYIRQKFKGHRVFWWVWANSTEVQPVTLDKIRKGGLKLRGVVEIPVDKEFEADGAELISDLTREPGE